ncbi:MAG TPA: 2-oxoacid:acceptor oxidoreductase family protein, partial [Spirochaetales bacterium]|nr:2-oxoacid:acceptor oxidoreductase family protein [Spirochaetales bacterium]
YGTLMGKGLIIVDSSVCLDPAIAARTVAVPILDTAATTIGKKVVANIVALGVLGGVSGVVRQATLEKAVLNRVPKGTEDLNLKALRAGFELAAKATKA